MVRRMVTLQNWIEKVRWTHILKSDTFNILKDQSKHISLLRDEELFMAYSLHSSGSTVIWGCL